MEPFCKQPTAAEDRHDHSNFGTEVWPMTPFQPAQFMTKDRETFQGSQTSDRLLAIRDGHGYVQYR